MVNYIKDSSLEEKKYRKGYTTSKKILLGFLIAILAGTVLLSLPIASVSGKPDILTALFTATTSVCVTGLVVVDTYSYWTLFGKVVILILIQLGGLGIVAFTSALAIVTRRKVTLKNRVMIHDAFGLNNLSGLVKFVKKVILGTFCVEMLGAILYLPSFIPRFGLKGIWFAFFNAISAFCNAGIDIIGPDSLMSFYSDPLVLIDSMFLIVMGGLGFVVWWDIIDTGRKVKNKKIKLKSFFDNLRTHSKIVLVATFTLLVSAWIFVFILEFNNPDTIGNMSLGDKLLNSCFQSFTLRTAGFAAVNQGGLKDSTVLISIIYMLIGGSPVGTAGGIKTVSIAVIFCSVIATIKGRDQALVFKKSINEGLIKRAISVAFISIMFLFVFSILLMETNGINFVDAVFEMGSAFATVGLSRGITGSLNPFGRILVIVAMYLGRIGPISMFIAFSNRYSSLNSIHVGEADIIVG